MTLSHFYRLAPAAKFCNRFSAIRLGNYRIFARGDSQGLKVIEILCCCAEEGRYEFLSPISAPTINVKPMKFIFSESTFGPFRFGAGTRPPAVVNVVLNMGWHDCWFNNYAKGENPKGWKAREWRRVKNGNSEIRSTVKEITRSCRSTCNQIQPWECRRLPTFQLWTGLHWNWRSTCGETLSATIGKVNFAVGHLPLTRRKL